MYQQNIAMHFCFWMRCNPENYTENVFLEYSHELGGFYLFEMCSFYCLHYHNSVAGLCWLFCRDILCNSYQNAFVKETTCTYKITEYVCLGHKVMESWWFEELNPSLADRIYICDVCFWCQCADSMLILKCVVVIVSCYFIWPQGIDNGEESQDIWEETRQWIPIPGAVGGVVVLWL